MKFHTTASTRIISFLVLLIVSVLVVIIPFSIEQYIIDTPIIVNNILQIEERFGVRIEVGHIESNIFDHIQISSLSASYNDNTFLTIESLHIALPWYRLIGSALFNQNIEIDVKDVDIVIDSMTSNHLIETFTSDSTTSPSSIAMLVKIDDIDIDVTNADQSITSTIPSLSLEYSDEAIQSLRFDAIDTVYKNDTTAISMEKVAFETAMQEDNAYVTSLESSLIDLSVEGEQSVTLSLTSLGAQYDSVQQYMSGTLNLSGKDISIDSIIDGEQLGGSLTTVTGELQVEEFTLANVSILGEYLSIAYNRFSLQNDLFTFDYQNNEDSGHVRFDSTVSIFEDDTPIVEGEMVESSFQRTDVRSSLRVTAASLALLDSSAAERFMNLSWIGSIALDDPYLLLSREIDSDQLLFETSSQLTSDLSYELDQQISTSIVSDGTLNIGRQTIEHLNVDLSDFSSTLLPHTLDIKFNIYGSEVEYPFHVSFNDLESFSGSYNYNRLSERGEFSLNMNSMELSDFDSLIDHFYPSLSSFIGVNTSLSGNINGEMDRSFINGKANASVALSNIIIGDSSFNGAATLLASADEDTFSIDLATITTEGFGISYEGSIDRESLYPRGILEATEVDSGRSLLSISFVQTQNREVGYSIQSSLLPSFMMNGVGRYTTLDEIYSEGTFSLNNYSYGMTTIFDKADGTIVFSLSDLSLLIDYLSNPSHIGITIEADNFVLPAASENELILGGQVNGDISLSDGIYLFTGEDVIVSNINYLNVEDADISLSFVTDKNQFIIERLEYKDQFGTLEGDGEISNRSVLDMITKDLNYPKITLDLEGSNDERLQMTLISDTQDPSTALATIDISQFPLNRINPQLSSFSTSALIAFTSDALTYVDGEGQVTVTEDSQDGAQISLALSLLDDGVYVSDAQFTKGSFSLENGEIALPFNGNIGASLDFLLTKPLIYRDASSTAHLSLETQIESSSNFFTWSSHIIDQLSTITEVTVENRDVVLFGLIEQSDGVHTISKKEDIVTISSKDGGYLDGFYDLGTNEIDFKASKDFLFPMEATGYIDSQRISLDVSQLSIDFTYLNALFNDPSIYFEEGLFTGDVLIDGDLTDPDYYGTMSANAVSVSLFWLPDQVLTVKNPVLSLYENLFTLPLTKTIASKSDGTIAEGLFSMEAEFENWNLNQYDLEAIIDKGTASVYVPVPAIDMVVEAEAKGDFNITGSLQEELLFGDIYIDSGQVGFGIKDLPDWFLPKARTSIDMNFTTGRNASFVYPNEESPIVSAVLADNQQFSISLTAPAMTFALEGDLNLRSGEIYYIQENFYITEGSIIFPELTNLNIESSEPKINLRARLRKFDSNSERIDIYLILQNNSLTNINPRFESIPARSTNEILQLLGQNFLSSSETDSQESGFSSVLSAATAATDVISRLGIIQGTGVSFGFSSIIKESFGLDVFTIRSNLIQNLLLDAIPGITSEDTSSPFSRYLDNTTIYLGKYFGDELYLQGLLTLRRDSTGDRTSFLASDLAIDTELNIEWLNDLATFSFFTQPEELSIFNLFDTMGFSVTKNFEF